MRLQASSVWVVAVAVIVVVVVVVGGGEATALECAARGGGHAVCADYMLSNNHVNLLITSPVNMEDEELLSYYITFLKTLSLKLNERTIQFFFNDVRGAV